MGMEGLAGMGWDWRKSVGVAVHGRKECCLGSGNRNGWGIVEAVVVEVERREMDWNVY